MASMLLARAARLCGLPRTAVVRCRTKASSTTPPPAATPAAASATRAPPARRRYELSTRVVAMTSASGDPHQATSMPVYQTATFGMSGSGEGGAYDYTRSGNPTRDALQACVADIEHGAGAFAFTSGMAALTAAVRALVPSGGRVVAGSDLYGGMHRMLSHTARTAGVTLDFVDMTDLAALEAALQAAPTTLVCIETPSNPLMEVVDVRRVCALSRTHDALVLADSSLMSPALMTPLDLGVDVVVHSATKFMSGHSDVMAGVVVAREEAPARQIGFLQNAEGAALAPFDCWLVLRGLKTMSLRVAEAQRNATMICDFLRQHPAIGAVHYLHPRDIHASPACKLHYSQARGGGSVLSFVPASGSVDFSKHLLDATELFKTTVSFGSVHSLIEMPCLQSHASIPEEERHLPPSLVRIAVGVEDVNDLLADLSGAIDAARAQGADAHPPPRCYPLGCPLPHTEAQHAVGASMPLWADVIGYEEGDERVHSALSIGYPRFKFAPDVQRLMDWCASEYGREGDTAVPVPSARTALKLHAFATSVLGPERAGAPSSEAVRTHDLGIHGVCCVTLPAAHAAVGKAFWQHTGNIVSSRTAHAVLERVEHLAQARRAPAGLAPGDAHLARQQAAAGLGQASDARHQLRRRIAGMAAAHPGNVYLFQSGMAAVSAAHDLLRRALPAPRRALKAIVFGYPYLDTLKLLQHPALSPGAHFVGDNCYETLERLLAEGASAVYLEFPSNPLLRSPDLARIVRAAHAHGVPVVVDDTVASFGNVNLAHEGGADLLASSLTKLFSGYGNAMGGSLVLNPASPFFDALTLHATAAHEDNLNDDDALVLLTNAVDYESRNQRINNSAEKLAEYLRAHPAVETVYYPKFVTPRLYERHMRDNTSGYGGLMSVVLRDKAAAAPVYDALPLAKGPGFGTSFSLACPYTLLAHYHELAFAQAYGVHPSLLRMWVGLEPAEQIISAWETALNLAAGADAAPAFAEVSGVDPAAGLGVLAGGPQH